MSTVSPISAETAIARPFITLKAAKLVIEAGLAEAKKHGFHMSIAVVDPSGELVAFERDDATSPVTPQVAMAKARTAAFLRAPSKVFEDFVNSGLPSFLSTPNVTPLQGGVPIIVNGQVIGAVGVSGASGEDDARTAQFAADVIKA